MNATEMKAALLRRREFWVTVAEKGDGDAKRTLRVQLARPPETAVNAMIVPARGPGSEGKVTIAVELEHVLVAARGWDGFIGEDIMGAGVGDSDPVVFDASLFAVVVEDDVEMKTKLAGALLKAIIDHSAKVETAAKN